MNIQITHETAAALGSQAAAAGLDLQQYLAHLAGVATPTIPVAIDRAAWLTRWQQLVDSMPGSNGGVDDSRESIYD